MIAAVTEPFRGAVSHTEAALQRPDDSSSSCRDEDEDNQLAASCVVIY